MKRTLILALSVLFVLSAVSVASAVINPIWNPNGVWGAGMSAAGDEYADATAGYYFDVDGNSFLYNWPQQYVGVANPAAGTAGPHGGYTDSTNRCRDCHAVHQASGSYKLLRANARYEACDFCHGLGSGAGKNIAMDNNIAEAPAYTTEYDQGHSLNYGDGTTSYRAPSDSSPAWYPVTAATGENGFSCQDCHSPHANPNRIADIIDNGDSGDIAGTAGSDRFFLVKNPDAADGDDSVADSNTKYADGVTNWSNPVYLTQWCADCHDANIGEYQNKSGDGPIATFSPNAMSCWDQETGGYNMAYSHDCSNVGFTDNADQEWLTTGIWQPTGLGADGFPDVNPDDTNNGPTCRQCHAATASGTGAVSGTPASQNYDLERDWWESEMASGGIYESDAQDTAADPTWQLGGGADQAGYSFPHRSQGYKLLIGAVNPAAPVLDQVCLDCHKYGASGYALP